jgi:hypothetical protein
LELVPLAPKYAWATSIRQSDFMFPVIEGSHILALSLSVGLIVLLDLRLLRLVLPSERGRRS